MRAIVGLGLLFLAGVCVPKGFATTIEIVSHRHEYRRASAVVVGTVTSISTPRDGRGYAVRMRVDKRWKGPRAPELTVRSDQGLSGCGLRFEVGDKYLVYAVIDQETPDTPRELRVFPCSRSRQLDRLTAERVREYKQLNSRWFRLGSHLPL
jgi:hypothetical protein